MAIFLPDFEVINRMKVPPTEGEMYLLRFLERTLDNSYEVFFNPYMNGDRPDIIIMRKGGGVLIIEVKDWNLELYRLDANKQWLINDGHRLQGVKSPISQALKYKDNLFELHVDKLLQEKIYNKKTFRTVACAVYFHNATEQEVKNKVIRPFDKDKKYQTFIKYNIDLLGQDSLSDDSFKKVLYDRWLSRKSIHFSDKIYHSVKRFISPPLHLLTDGIELSYSRKQLEIIHSDTKEQRIKGVMGSGKTTVLAAKAVYAYKKAIVNNPEAKVLILTFNITLKNFIHDKISQVREEFPWGVFTINNYHQFIKSELNNQAIQIKAPNGINGAELTEYFEKHYFSNISLFQRLKDELPKYDVVLIDEIQDYRRPWMDIIKGFFLAEGGIYTLFGDVKQNIYGNITESKDVSTNVKARPVELKTCYRSDFKVKDLAIEFQKNIFKDKYEIDDFNKSNGELSFNFEKQGSLNYMYLENIDSFSSLYSIIHDNSIIEKESISPNDITILGHNIKNLRDFDSYYRYATNEKTTTMFATLEIMYVDDLNLIGKTAWTNEFYKLLPEEYKELELARLMILFRLQKKYPVRFKPVLIRQCEKIKLCVNQILPLFEKYKSDINKLEEKVRSKETKIIDRNKKIHFWMNGGGLKISTIHSFKGWESKVVFLLIDKDSDTTDTFDEIMYTGITRSRSNLIIVNFGNEAYNLKIRPIIEGLK